MGNLDFIQIYNENHWESEESRSGSGSSLDQTKHIRETLPLLWTKFQIASVLDSPCGDFNWMQHVDLGSIKYTGGDIVPELITKNQQNFGSGKISFRKLDLLKDELPRADAILCRDLLGHLLFHDCLQIIHNFCRSDAKYLIITTFSDRPTNSDEAMFPRWQPLWRPLNMQKPPFNFPPPLAMINERCTERYFGQGFSDKCLGIWRICDIDGNIQG